MKRYKKTMDGNQAAAHVSYAYSEVAAIYPITPSSTMAETVDEWSAAGRENIFGETVKVTQMQSEAGAAGAVHGSLIAGALTTTFTASQGLLLMIPNLYKMAGELLPAVINVAARAIATHALSIFGDHQDIYACRQTGVAMLVSSSVQEVMDLTPAAHCSAIAGRVPFINFFDGFRTSHEIQKIEVWEYEDLKELLDMEAVRKFKQDALNPNHARMMGSAQNPDVFFQAREASNSYYDALPGVVTEYLHKINEKIGRDYKLFNYYGHSEADRIIIAMGSVCETAQEVVDCLNRQGEKTGVVKVHLYRPFSAKHLLDVIPNTVKKIVVLDRTKEPGSIGEPLYLDVLAAIQDSELRETQVYSGRYGLGSKDTTPEQLIAALENTEKKRFTIGIRDDVTHLSLEDRREEYIEPENTVSCKFWGLGGDGTVGANKNAVKIIGDYTEKYVQAYFEYDSKKSRGVTISHLRFGDNPIQSAYLVNKADFVACHNETYVRKYNMVQDVKDGGIFLLNCTWKQEELEDRLPGQVKRYIAEHDIQFYIIDGIGIGKEIGLNNKINTILQAAFFSLTKVIPREEAISLMKEAAKKSYLKKGEKIVEMNYKAIDRGFREYVRVEVPFYWSEAEDEPLHDKTLKDRKEVEEFVDRIQKVINSQEGSSLLVSDFLPYVDGRTPSGTTAHERRNVAVDVPEWIPENCIQCNRCSYVCPHAVIRPVVMNEEEQKKAPEGMPKIEAVGMKGMTFSIVISDVDCTGCGSCAGVCPGKKGEKALTMCPSEAHKEMQQYFDYGKTLQSNREAAEKFKPDTVKGSQFLRPYMEFSGACAGCGETPYVKLVTQLFGERMYIANATGCSSIWGNSFPASSYSANEWGKGPAWGNSLFEDAAEYGYGMLLAQKAIRKRLKGRIRKLQDILGEAATQWLDTFEDGKLNGEATKALIEALEEKNTPQCREILIEKDFLSKKSQWIFGGDGWAYDIGFGGLDHIVASGEDINIMILDTEVYSNTGGQASKATPEGSVAKFSAKGKMTRKKDLAAMLMSYGNVYVAQIAMGADYNQTVKAITEAEKYNGPSVIIAYATCIEHGIKAGMGSSQHEEAKAVEAGYWHLFRYSPDKGLVLDSKPPVKDYREFLSGENRYEFLYRTNPERAKELFREAEECAGKRYGYLEKLAALYGRENQ